MQELLITGQADKQSNWLAAWAFGLEVRGELWGNPTILLHLSPHPLELFPPLLHGSHF